MERPPDERETRETERLPPEGPQSPAAGSGSPEGERLPAQAPASTASAQPQYGQAQYGQAPYAQYPPAYQQPYVPVKTNGLAVASLVLGILWLYWVGSILALVFGMIAKSQIDAAAGTQQGRGLAIAGIVLGWVGVGFLLLFVLFFGGIAGCGALLSSS